MTRASLLARSDDGLEARRGAFPLAWSVFVCAPHHSLATDLTFRDNLLNVLLLQ